MRFFVAAEVLRTYIHSAKVLYDARYGWRCAASATLGVSAYGSRENLQNLLWAIV